MAERQPRQQDRADDAGQVMDKVTLQSRHSREHSPDGEERAPNLVAGMLVPDVIEYLPMCFAIKKLRKHKYIELSYPMPEGRAEAARNKLVSLGKIFTLAKDDDFYS